jgi:hypothetical protein
MTTAFESLVGRSLEWTGTHHSKRGDFTDISTHVVRYETADECYVTAAGKLVGEAKYCYKRMDSRMSILIYHPKVYQGRTGVGLYAMLDFKDAKDRAVILADGKPFAIADGTFREVETPEKPTIQ